MISSEEDRISKGHPSSTTMFANTVSTSKSPASKHSRAFSLNHNKSSSSSSTFTASNNNARPTTKSSSTSLIPSWSFLILLLIGLNVVGTRAESDVTESEAEEYVTNAPPTVSPLQHLQHQFPQVFAKGSTTPRSHRSSEDAHPPGKQVPNSSSWRNEYLLMNESVLSKELTKDRDNLVPKEKKVPPPISAVKPMGSPPTPSSTPSPTKIPGLVNETREALQEEGSHHQPVVFVGGAGYIPPSNLRARPLLEAPDPLWNQSPFEGRYPSPLQSAWDRNYRNPYNMTRVQHIEAECQDDFMKIRVAFNGSFNGLVYSSGYSYDPDCVYVNGTGRDYYEYLIRLNRCGTLGASNHIEGRKEPSKNFMWNTISVQYNPMIEEEWDEHFKVTCEYGYDWWKTVTFPFLDVEVATGNPVVFTLTPPECFMEVRYGFGSTGARVGGPVRVGDPLTLMINMRSQYDGFDIVVNDCYAHNGGSKKIQLIDHYGCPVDSKLMSPFRGTWTHTNIYETQVYAYLKTFRFTGSPALYIECDVRMCHGSCPSQPCYWRKIDSNGKHINKRSIDDQSQVKNSSLSENISLFQALRVLQEDEEVTESLKNPEMTTNPDSVCMKSGTLSALIGAGTLLFVLLGMVLMVMCFRLKRIKSVRDGESTADILRPYSHHANSHWQSSNSSLAKPRVLP